MSKKYNPTLDSLRGISILWVVLHHVPVGLPSALEFIRKRGDLGVELFFAISGILVTQSILHTFGKDQSKTKSIKEYFVKRASRIFPPFYLTLTGLFSLSVFKPSLKTKITSISDILFSFPTYLYNYFRFSSSGEIPGSFGIFWSLCFEEQFYLLLLGIFIFFKRRSYNTIFIFLMITSIILRLIFALTPDVDAFYMKLQYFTHLRLDAILLGSFAILNYEKTKSFIKSNRHFSLFTISLLLFAIINHNYIAPINRSLNYILVSLSFTALSLSALIDNKEDLILKSLKRFINNKLLTKVGIVSYEIYLTHQIFNGILAKTSLKAFPGLYTLALFTSSFFGAYLLHKFFSAPVNIWIRERFLKVKLRTYKDSNVLISEN